MTRGEIAALEVLMAEFREFRMDDRNWKQRTEVRLAKVENFVTSEKAIDEKEAARGVSRRAYVAASIAAAGVTASIVLGVLNLLT